MSTLLEEGYEALLNDVIRVGAVRTLYQPIVDLESFEVVGYEALARGPEGSRLEQPHLLFETARACGRLDDLDWLCRTTALTGALEAGLKQGTSLFLNVEPAALASPLPHSYWRVWERSRRELSVLFEVTERALTASPASLLRRCEEIRELGWGIALDDVGVAPSSLAMLPLLRPDVIKLDRLLMSKDAGRLRNRIVHAVSAEHERRGTAVVAEGIENEDHIELALAMGATLGQGWFFGRPDGLPSSPVQPDNPIAVRRIRPTADANATPFTMLSEKRPTRVGTKRVLREMTRHLEEQLLT
ncbi:MAG TPA: EAL domain-containing protein, partial [Actinomycetota bacterium]|nr:EAL domain-containing protein [Actinomycetota bacterium]